MSLHIIGDLLRRPGRLGQRPAPGGQPGQVVPHRRRALRHLVEMEVTIGKRLAGGWRKLQPCRCEIEGRRRRQDQVFAVEAFGATGMRPGTRRGLWSGLPGAAVVSRHIPAQRLTVAAGSVLGVADRRHQRAAGQPAKAGKLEVAPARLLRPGTPHDHRFRNRQMVHCLHCYLLLCFHPSRAATGSLDQSLAGLPVASNRNDTEAS